MWRSSVLAGLLSVTGCSAFGEIASHPWIVEVGGEPCGYEVPIGDEFQASVDGDGTNSLNDDAEVIGRMIDLGTVPELVCVEGDRCSLAEPAVSDLRLNGFDAVITDRVDVALSVDQLADRLHVSVDVYRTCDGRGCSDLAAALDGDVSCAATAVEIIAAPADSGDTDAL